MSAEWRYHLLQTVVRALPCREFELKLVTQPSDGPHGRCIRTVLLRPDQFVAHHAQIGRWSAQRLNVFMRPMCGPTHVLLDLDTPDALDEVLTLMRCDGITPSLVVETSPGHAQIWCSLPGRAHPVEVHRAASRLLAERYGGDPGSAKPSQLGRVPGTRNPKPSRAMSDGTPPLVLIKRAGFNPSHRLIADAVLRAEQDAHEHVEAVRVSVETLSLVAYEVAHVSAMLAEAVERHGGDRSDADFEIACVMLRAGTSPERVASLLMATSEKAQEREARRAGAGAYYVERTVQRAMEAAGVSPTEKAGRWC
jgi:hypothetical protein